MPVARSMQPAAYLALGSAGTLAVQNLGHIALASGWVPTAGAGFLGAGAVAVFAAEVWRLRGGTHPAPVGGTPPWDQAMRALDWLRANEAIPVPDADLEGYLRAKLGSSLKSLPSSKVSGWQRGLPPAVALLALAFAARGLGKPRDLELSARILAGLREAHRHDDISERGGVLFKLLAAVPEQELGRICAEALDPCEEAHGTVASFLMGLFASARGKWGGLPSAEFLWLKGIDRGLWYALDNVGRSAFHVEGLAAVDHHAHELREGRAVRAPYVEGAIAELAAFRRDPTRCPLTVEEDKGWER